MRNLPAFLAFAFFGIEASCGINNWNSGEKNHGMTFMNFMLQENEYTFPNAAPLCGN